MNQNPTNYSDTPRLIFNKDTRKEWLKNLPASNTLRQKNTNLIKDNSGNYMFASQAVEDAFEDDMFIKAFGTLPEFNSLVYLPREERRAFYNKYQGSADIYKAREYDKGKTGFQDYIETSIPFAPVQDPQTGQINYNALYQQQVQNAQETQLAQDIINAQNSSDDIPIENEKQYKAQVEKLVKEAEELYPMYDKAGNRSTFSDAVRGLQYQEMGIPSMAVLSDEALQLGGVKKLKEARGEYIRDRIKIPEQNNPYKDISEEDFVRNLSKLSSTYNLLQHTKWLPDDDVNAVINKLYNESKNDLNAGRVYKVEAALDKAFGNIVEKYQPGWFEGGGDEFVHSRRQVFFENAAAGAVENLMDFILFPVGVIEGAAESLITGKNFAETSSYLPSLAHDVAHAITGDYATAYGDSLFSAAANSGYTIGTMAIDAALMAIPVAGVSNRIAKSTKYFDEAIKAAKIAKFNKIYGTAASLDFGFCEGTVDALEARESILKDAREKAATLPMSQRESFMQNAIDEANAAYGRILLEESLVVNAGTLLGLGFNGSLLSQATSRSLRPSIWSQITSNGLEFAGRTLYNVGKLTLGELLEEGAQGLSSGINEARANYNIDNYATALHYGLGADYLTNTQLGFLQGLERFTPEAWVKMDPENLAKQVLLSTLFFRCLHLPGKGKTRSQIAADNNTLVGKIWDNIRKFTPIQTGIGQIIADAKEVTYDIENRLEKGFQALINNDDLVATLQSQAALTDIGIQMQRAINEGNITKYQQLATAYQAAQGVMLADANQRNTRFGKNYLQVLQKRADFNNLNEEDKLETLKAWRTEVQANPDLSEEEQIQFVSNTAAQTLKMMKQAQQIYKDIQNDVNITGQDIRPLVFAQLLYESTPEAIKDNWTNFKLSEDSPIFNRKDLNQEAVNYLLTNYFGQSDAQERSKALTKRRDLKTITQEDWNKAWSAIMQELSSTNPNINDIIKTDINLSNWRKELYRQWQNMYDRVLKGEGVLPSDFNKKHKEVSEELSGNPNRKIKKFQNAIKQAKSISELRALYNQEKELNEERRTSRRYDVDKVLRDIKDPEVQKKITELDNIERAKNSLQNLLNQSSLNQDLKNNLYDQIEDIANTAENTSPLYDISNYSLNVNPEEYDNIAGQLQEIINNAKNLATTTQSVNGPVTEQKGATQNPTPTDLGERDVDTAPAVNTNPITKLTVEKATQKIKEAQELTASGNYAEADKIIQEVQTRCPDGYKVVKGGTSVALIKVKSEPVTTTVNVETEQPKNDKEDPTFAAPEDVVEIEEEIPYEDIVPTDTSLDTYPDTDVRSVIKVAIGKFKNSKKVYAFPIRDEQVDVNTKVIASYTTKELDDNGQEVDVTYTNETDGQLEIISVEEYNKRTETNSKDYMSLEEIVKNYPRPNFVNKETNQEVPKQQTKPQTSRTAAQQERLDNNITPARNEIAPQYLPKGDNYKAKEEGKEYTRLGDENYRNIDSQLEEQSAFEYRNSGRVQVGDKIQFVASEEDMPDGSKQVVIWEVTTPKDKEIPEDSKFKGMQVLSVLDQTNMTGDRAALIARIREAYDAAGRPDSFLYDKESFEVSSIVGGVVPFVQTNPIEAKSNSTIESTNLKKGFTKKNGKYGTSFWNQRLGKMVHCPVIFKQLVRNSDGSINEIVSNPNVTNVETVKHQYASQSETNEVMLVVPTPTGYKAAHSVYVMRRDIENAVDKYIQAIRNGKLGEELIKRMSPRLTDNKAKTFFSDFLRFNRGISERVIFDKNYKRLELGYNNNGISTTLLYATQIGEDKYVITEQDARNVINDNEGKGFTFAEIAKEYLSSLVQNNEVGASVQINMNAINEKNSIIDNLIDDGFLWAPNSINARFGMENTGFSAPINQETKQEQQRIKQQETKPEPKKEPKTAPIEKLSDESIAKPKQQVPKTIKKDHTLRVPRKKLTVESKTEIPTPNPVQTTEINPTNIENNIAVQLNYNNLNEEQKQHIQEKGFVEESWNNLTQLEKENVLNC